MTNRNEKVVKKFWKKFLFLEHDIFSSQNIEPLKKKIFISYLVIVCSHEKETVVKEKLKHDLDLLKNIYGKIFAILDEWQIKKIWTFDNATVSFEEKTELCKAKLHECCQQLIDLFDLNKQHCDLLLQTWIYLIYNSVECRISKKIEKNLEDKNYDHKVEIIKYNTVLFAELKSLASEALAEHVNDYIVRILGLSNDLIS